MTAVTPSKKKIQIVQLLRGIAAVCVMGYHFKGILKPGDPFFLEIDYIFNAGPAGVDLFFVISGFIMVLVTGEKTGGFAYAWDFFTRRLIRIWPVYILVSITYYFIIFRLNLVPESLDHLLSSLFFMPYNNSEPPYLGYAFLPVGWSLNYEVYFYFLLAISLVSRRWRWIIFMFILVSTLVVLPLIVTGRLTFKADAEPVFVNSFLNLITNPIVWNFVYGLLIGFVYNRKEGLLNRFRWLSSPSTTFLAVLLSVWQILSGFYGGHGPFQWGIGVAVLFFFLIISDYADTVTFPQWMVYLGEISYSIYLWHLPVLASVTIFFDRVLGFPIFKEGISAFFLSIGVTIWVSHWSYMYLEKKLGFFLERRLLSRR